MNEVLEEMLAVHPEKELFTKVHKRVQSFVDLLGAQNFYGYIPKSTLSSLLIQHLYKKLPAEELDSSPPSSELLGRSNERLSKKKLEMSVRTVASHILQIAKPEALLLKKAALPAHYLSEIHRSSGTLQSQEIYQQAVDTECYRPKNSYILADNGKHFCGVD